MESNEMLTVVNRHGNLVVYKVPESSIGLERTFAPGESKQIAFDELQKLSFMPGGMYILKHFLVIKNDEAIKLILGDVEPEYYYSAEDVKELLVNGTLDQLLDCLDFGTFGVLEIIKNLAVELEIPDTRKREAIKNKTGLDINKAIELKHAETDGEETTPEVKTRRTTAAKPASTTTTRRATTPATTK